MKLKNVQAYPIDGVPDHLIYECQVLGNDLFLAITPFILDANPNIILGAINFLHAALIKKYVSDDIDQQKKAAQLCAIGLIKNVYMLNKISVDEL